MRKSLILLLLPILLWAGESSEYTLSGFFSYRSHNAKIGDQEVSLNITQGGIRTSVLMDETKELYFSASYGKFSFGDKMVFSALPVSVSTKFSKPGFSISAGGFLEPYSFSEDFSFVINPEVSYSYSSHKWNISQGPYLEGTVNGKIYFIEGKIGLLGMYEGNDNFEPYMGLYLDYFWGSAKFSEKIKDLTGDEKETIKPKLPIMLLLGLNFYYGDNLSGGIYVGLLNGLSASGSLGFTFEGGKK